MRSLFFPLFSPFILFFSFSQQAWATVPPGYPGYTACYKGYSTATLGFIEGEAGNLSFTEGACAAEVEQFRQEFSQCFSRIRQTAAAFNKWNSTPHAPGEVPDHFGPKNTYHRHGFNKFIQKFSMYEYKNGKMVLRDPEQLIKLFCHEVIKKHTKMVVDWSSVTSSLRTLNRLRYTLNHNKRLKSEALGRLEDLCGKDYLHLFINTYEKQLLFEKKRLAEKKAAKKTASERTKKEKEAREEILRIGKNTQNQQASTEQIAASAQEWVRKERSLQQQEAVVTLTEKERKNLEALRSALEEDDKCVAPEVHKKMVQQADVELYQNDGKVSKKLHRRLCALQASTVSGFKKTNATYCLNTASKIYMDHSICTPEQLEHYYGTEIQQNMHREIVGLVNRYACYVEANGKDDELSSKETFFDAVGVAIGLRDKLDSQKTERQAKMYGRAYSFLDFCHNWLKVKVGQRVLGYMQRVGKGFEQGGLDVQRFLQNGLRDYLKSGSSRLEKILRAESVDTLKDFLEEQKASIARKRDALGEAANDLFQKIKEQPLDETVGDALEFLSRKLVHASAMIVAGTAIVSLGQAGAALAAGVASATSVQGALDVSVGSSGVAVASASKASVVDAIAVAAGQAAQAVCGVVESAKGLLARMGDGSGGGEGYDTDFEMLASHIKKSGELPENYIKKEEARALGWDPQQGNLHIVAPGKSIGGNVFRNSSGILPNSPGRIWYEADVGYAGGYRGVVRILYSNDGLIYKTFDHYQTVVRIR